ncbi:4168_t:CDS:2 [Funneliformis mosseae]|uniref:4168_t:CDS:1 n=1 Tax=Funneliformis mosseae TaxID=27381 RepID=A0A9N9FMY9_FUNMO|nr:4168_t:CDS:2 [Funneliformis mosseae]
MQQILIDPNVRDVFFGKKAEEFRSKSTLILYVVVENKPKKPLQCVRGIPFDVIKKFDNILNTQLGRDFRSKFINLIAISLDWKNVDGYYIEKPAIIFYVIRKGVIPIGNDYFPKNIDDIETDHGISGTICAGTLGMFVKDSNEQNERIYLLTNDYVIRMKHGSEIQNKICQPADSDYVMYLEKELKAKLDKKLQSNVEHNVENEIYDRIKDLEFEIKKCSDIKKLEKDLKYAKRYNTHLALFTNGLRDNYKIDKRNYGVDAAIAKLEQSEGTLLRKIKSRNFAIGNSAFEDESPILITDINEDIHSVDTSKPIYKVGCTSGLTKGYIKEGITSILSKDGSLILEQQLNFHGVQMKEIKVRGKENFPFKWLDRQILVLAKKGLFMDEGDSGCIWFDQDGIVIALGHGTLCTTSGEFAVGSSISTVLKALKVSPYFEQMLKLYICYWISSILCVITISTSLKPIDIRKLSVLRLNSR